jgi:uncharacterized membrane protein
MTDSEKKPPAQEDPRATRARRIIYIAMAIGILLPFVVILIVDAFNR